jgi:hypothetical protein
MKPAVEAEEDRHALIDGSDLSPRKFAEHAPDPPLVDLSQMIGQREGPFGEAAWAGREGRIKQGLARSPCDRYHAHEWKTLVADHVRIARRVSRHAVRDRVRGRVHHDYCAATEPHSGPSTQPSPGTHRTGLPQSRP